MRGLTLFGAALLGMAAAPASASTMISFWGTTDWIYRTDRGFAPAKVPWVARFRYSDEGRLEWSRIRLGQGGWTYPCPAPDEPWTPCSGNGPTIQPGMIAASFGFTPEDGVSMLIIPATPFSDLSWPDGRFLYDVKPEDYSRAYLSYTLRSDGHTYDFLEGVGPVSRVAFNVPEPASWSLMLAGFGLLGTSMRRRRARA